MADAILNPREMQEIERAAFADGIDAETLMDQAGEGIANAILEAKTNTVDLPDLGAAPGRHVQADQQAMRPAVILQKIDE